MEGVEKRSLLVFGILGLFIIMFTGFSEAAVTCSSADQIILRLSDVTNAHGEVWNGAGSYTEEICYDTIFGVTGDGDRTCSGTNKVVGLFGSTNAHAEDPGLSNYGTNVCYGNLICTARTGACLSGESLVLSLSSSTNAHLASDSSYSQNICCFVSGEIITHAECVSNTCTVVAGDGITSCGAIGSDCNLPNVTHAECVGNTCMAVLGTGADACSADANCTGEPIAHAECISNTCTEVAGAGVNACGVIGASCGVIPSCSLTSASWSKSGEVIERTIVDMIITGTNCAGKSIDFEIWENDFLIDDLVTTRSGNFDNLENWTTTWTYDGDDDIGQDPRDYYFKAIVAGTSESEESSTLAVSQLPVTYCDPVILCGSYYTPEDGSPTAENACNADVCDVADFSVETKKGDGFCDSSSTSCFCEWDTSKSLCESAWEVESPPSPPGEAGRCTYTETTTGSCEDGGFLTSSWTATWTGSNPNDACADGGRRIVCPAQIQLAFFNLYNMLITLLAIAGIYGIISLRKKH